MGFRDWMRKFLYFSVVIDRSIEYEENGRKVEHGKRTTILNGRKRVKVW